MQRVRLMLCGALVLSALLVVVAGCGQSAPPPKGAPDAAPNTPNIDQGQEEPAKAGDAAPAEQK